MLGVITLVAIFVLVIALLGRARRKHQKETSWGWVAWEEAQEPWHNPPWLELDAFAPIDDEIESWEEEREDFDDPDYIPF